MTSEPTGSTPAAAQAPEASAPEPIWDVLPYAPPEAVAPLVRDLRVAPIVASVLWSRGLHRHPDGVRAALEPELARAPIAHLDRAAERLEAAVRRGARIRIHGDYDADGVSGTAVLWLGLRALGADVSSFIPNRLHDGYGVHPDRVPEHAEACDLFVTVDCGVSNLAEVAALQARGVEVIVTDHHSRGEALPDCLVVHPRSETRDLPLTGAGVAFHLLWALHDRLGLEPPLEYADLATLGTIADVAPLLGENRALVRVGLERMPESVWPGVRASIRQTKLTDGVTARDVAFRLAPRLNAAGRLGEADLALELLTTASEQRARELAAYLDARNHDRQRIQSQMFEEAIERVDPEAPAVVIGDDDWHPGVMGIVASNLLERVYKPVFIHAKGKGSVRSTPGISAVGALRAAAQHLQRFGGHAQAAGFAIDDTELSGFRERIHAYVGEHPRPQPRVTADALLAASEISATLHADLTRLRPFGEGHPEPSFLVRGRLERARAVGRDNATLQLHVAGVKGVAWRMGDLADRLPVGRSVDVALSLHENEWRGTRSIEFQAHDIRIPEALSLADPADGEDAPGSARAQAVRRGAPPADLATAAIRVADVASADVSDEALARASAVWLEALPLAPPPADDAALDAPTHPLRRLLTRARRASTPVYLDLGPSALAAAEAVMAQIPTLATTRAGFVAVRRGRRLPFGTVTARRVQRLLEDLDLVDAHGHARRGVRRDPYESERLLAFELERYRLRGLLDAFEMLDDAGFAATVATLLLDSGSD